MISICLKNRRGRFSSTVGPDVPPHTTSRPPGRRARTERSHVAGPTLSTTTSTSPASRPSESNASAAPSVDRPVAAWPRRATWRSTDGAQPPGQAPAPPRDTPPPMPTMSTDSPAVSRARRSIRQAVRWRAGRRRTPPTTGRPARPRRCGPGPTTRSAWPPQRCSPTIWKPAASGESFAERHDRLERRHRRVHDHLVAHRHVGRRPSPTASTTPATSQPGTWGSGGRAGPGDPQVHVVQRVATGRTRTSSGPTARVGDLALRGSCRATRRGSTRCMAAR